jgi:hypothetical protein
MVAQSRSERLTCWGNAWLASSTSLDEADERIRGDDVAHHVLGLPDDPEPATLLLALGALRRAGTNGFSLALPAPGDPLGLAGPREFTEAALEAGEAVVCEGAGIGLVPYVIGAGVQWTAYPAHPAVPLVFSDAATDLAAALQSSIDVIAELDIARWRPELADAIGELRRVQRATDNHFPPHYPARADALATRSRTCLYICDLVLDDDGGARTAHEADTRKAALRELERAARRGLVAACAAPRG